MIQMHENYSVKNNNCRHADCVVYHEKLFRFQNIVLIDVGYACLIAVKETGCEQIELDMRNCR